MGERSHSSQVISSNGIPVRNTRPGGSSQVIQSDFNESLPSTQNMKISRTTSTDPFPTMDLSPAKFSFINANPLSKEEKETNRKIIRSKAMTGSQYVRNIRKRRTEKVEKEIIGVHLKARASSVGGGRQDPFRVLPSAKYIDYADELIDYSTNVSWPVLLPVGPDGQPNPLSSPSSWMKLLLRTPLGFQICMLSALSHDYALRLVKKSPIPSNHTSRRLYHKGESIRLLNENMTSTDPVVMDEVICAVLSLVFGGIEEKGLGLTKSTHSAFSSPLKDAQWLSVYGLLRVDPVHGAGLVKLIKRRGGLEKVDMPGLAEVLSYTDIIASTQDFRKPIMPLLGRHSNPHRTIISAMKLAQRFCGGTLGFGFKEDNIPGVTSEAYTCYQHICDMSALIDAYVEGIVSIPSIQYLTEQKNVTQHTLLSLPHGVELEFGIAEEQFWYEAVRLTVCIYSIAVIFPIPVEVGCFSTLVALLQPVIDNLSVPWLSCRRTLLWMLMLGGMAAKGTIWRPWFVERLRVEIRDFGIEDWDSMEAEMRRYLWYDTVCSNGGRIFWDEVMPRFSKHS